MRKFGQHFFGSQTQLLARFWRAAWYAARVRKGWFFSIVVLLLVIVLLQLVAQVLLNLWNRDFFDALQKKDSAALWHQAKLFIPIAASSIFLAAASVWGRMTAQRGWRESLTRHVVNKWLDKDHYHHLNHLNKGTENPEYRIAVDIRVSTDAPVDLALALISSVLTAFTFFGVLWRVGGSFEIFMFGVTVTIPGYLVVGAVLYSTLITALMVAVGHHLTSVIERLNQSEAEFRAMADAFRDDRTEDRSWPSDDQKRNDLWLKLRSVLLWWREFCWQLVRTTIISHGNFLLGPVVAWILCLPKYLSGAMSLGELTQTAAAFVTVQGAFNWLVDNYGRLADWQSSARRVAALLLAIDDIESNRIVSKQESFS